jgi:lipoprotein-anchoring transpeptidase ErfK/SrfK
MPRQRKSKTPFPPSILRGKAAKALTVLLSAVAIVSVLLAFRGFRKPTIQNANLAVESRDAKMDPRALRREISLAEKQILQLSKKRERLFPSGPAILIDSAANQIYLVQGSRTVLQDKCSTGTGFELTEESGKRTWTFDTPRGYFKVIGKTKNPVWYRPDWAFVEEGEPIPKSRSERAVANVLGDYAIAFGNGYFIHGTLYTRMLGTSITHGCVRVGDETLKRIYNAVQPGTPIWIY